jgi:hypothetical protein
LQSIAAYHVEQFRDGAGKTTYQKLLRLCWKILIVKIEIIMFGIKRRTKKNFKADIFIEELYNLACTFVNTDFGYYSPLYYKQALERMRYPLAKLNVILCCGGTRYTRSMEIMIMISSKLMHQANTTFNDIKKVEDRLRVLEENNSKKCIG